MLAPSLTSPSLCPTPNQQTALTPRTLPDSHQTPYYSPPRCPHLTHEVTAQANLSPLPRLSRLTPASQPAMTESCCLHLSTGDHIARIINCRVRWPHTGPGHRPPHGPSLCPHSSQRRKGKWSLSSEPPAACDLGRNLRHCPARTPPAAGCPAGSRAPTRQSLCQKRSLLRDLWLAPSLISFGPFFNVTV